jgi:hypothetical protein
MKKTRIMIQYNQPQKRMRLGKLSNRKWFLLKLLLKKLLMSINKITPTQKQKTHWKQQELLVLLV